MIRWDDTEPEIALFLGIYRFQACSSSKRDSHLDVQSLWQSVLETWQFSQRLKPSRGSWVASILRIKNASIPARVQKDSSSAGKSFISFVYHALI
jgi:hypothetical protein